MFLTLFVAVVSLLSASNKTAIDYYESGDMKKAKSLFLATTNLDAVDYYYLGMINLKENNKTAAGDAFSKGLQADPANLLNSVGQAALQLATDPKVAEKALKTISSNKLYKKDTKMQVAIAEAFALAKNKPLTDMYIAKAKKADKKSALPYIFEGNQMMDNGKNNEAAVSFENAVYFDPNSKIALVKLAQLYVGTRKQIAFDYLDKTTTLDPTYEYGWKTQADLRYRNGFYPEAKKAFEKYMSLIKPQPDDYQTYGEILYFNKDYAGSLNALAKAPVNTVTNRLKMYSLHDQNKYDEAIPFAQTLVNTTAKSDLIYQDYAFFAEMLSKTKDYENAAKFYELAYQTDTTRTGTLSEAARAYDRAKNYPKAIEFYQKVIDVNPAHTMADIYSLGASYYSAGTDAVATPDALKRNEYLTKAGEVFGTMTTTFPEHYLGYLSQARANSALDPETTIGLAKPFYDKALAIMLPNQVERKNDIMEVYQYMGIYFLKKDDYPQSRNYWVKVLEIDPENAIAKQVIASIDSVKRK